MIRVGDQGDTRAQLYVPTAEDRKAELSRVRNALRANNYKEWALDVPPARSKKQVTTTDKTTTKSTRPMLGFPYIYGAYLSSCHGPTSLTEYTYFISPATPSAQCSYTLRTKPPRRNCAAPSTTSRVTTTPTTPWGDEETPQGSVQRSF